MSPPGMTLPFLILRQDEARGLVTPAQALAATETAWRDYGTARRVLSTPSSQSLAGQGCVFKVKGAVLPGQGIAGFRLVADATDAAGREVTQDWFWLADPATGRPIALIEAFWLHLLRTAATGALAARLLAAPGTRIATLVGAGRIAAEMLAPLREALPGLAEIRVTARSADTAARFVAAHIAAEPALRAMPDVASAVAGAGLVLTMTSATAPFLAARHLARGATLIGLGDLELEPDVLTGWAGRFIIDDLAFATVAGSVSHWIKAGTLSQDTIAARCDADVGEVAAGLKPGRRNPAENILAIVQGMAVADLALAGLAHDRALSTGAGLRLDLGAPSSPSHERILPA